MEEENATIQVPGFPIPEIAYAMLEHFCEEADCDLEEALRIAVFHLLGSWEMDKQQRQEETNNDRSPHAGDGQDNQKAGSRSGATNHQPY